MTAGKNTRVLLAGLVTLLICTSTSISHAEESISLMSTLAEWQYPDSKFNGATLSDGGNPTLQSIKCTVVLTTPDAVSKVVDFYAKKLDVSPDSESPTTDGKPTPTKARSVIVQDDSKDRPVASARFFMLGTTISSFSWSPESTRNSGRSCQDDSSQRFNCLMNATLVHLPRTLPTMETEIKSFGGSSVIRSALKEPTLGHLLDSATAPTNDKGALLRVSTSHVRHP